MNTFCSLAFEITDLDEKLSKFINLDKTDFPFPWSRAEWEETFKSKNSLITFFEEGSDLIGFSLIEINKFESLGHLYKIVVANKYRKQKYALKLLKLAEEYLCDAGCNFVYLEVAVNNKNAISLYDSSGYVILNRIKQFYSNGDDAFAMQKILF